MFFKCLIVHMVLSILGYNKFLVILIYFLSLIHCKSLTFFFPVTNTDVSNTEKFFNLKELV